MSITFSVSQLGHLCVEEAACSCANGQSCCCCVLMIMCNIDYLTNWLLMMIVFVQYLMAHRLPRWERMFCYVLIPVSLALSAVGIVSSIRELISEFRGHQG